MKREKVTPGQKAIDEIYKIMLIDAEWSVREPGSFTWWPHGLAQRVSVTATAVSDGVTVSRVRIETDVLAGVRATKGLVPFVNLVNAHTALSALVYDPERLTLSHACAFNVHDQVAGWIPRIAAAAAQMQCSEAEGKAPGLQEMFGGRIAVSAHPGSGPRKEPDELLTYTDAITVPIGRGKSRFGRSDLRALAEGNPLIMSLDDPTDEELVGEVPFTGSTHALVRAVTGVTPEGRTALMRADVTRHPGYGSGILFTLRCPVGFGDRTPEVADELNRHQVTTTDVETPPLLGAWTTDPESGDLTYAMFVPSALHQPNLAAALGGYVAMQGPFAAQYLTERRLI